MVIFTGLSLILAISSLISLPRKRVQVDAYTDCTQALWLDTATVYTTPIVAIPPTLNCTAYPAGTGAECWLKMAVSKGHWRLKIKTQDTVGATLLRSCDSMCQSTLVLPPAGELDWKTQYQDTVYVLLSSHLMATATVELGRYQLGAECLYPTFVGFPCLAKLKPAREDLDQEWNDAIELDRKLKYRHDEDTDRGPE